ncbi:MAG TPA: lipopolysaccharide biosynthesis protein [Anaerohalosphaeraceae bacterium]|nr:lipopolysaccharide biosynthesis protein [Anaerohalosphaeraceae bacterium]
MNLVHRTLSGIGALMISQLVQGIGQLVILMILARLVGKEPFGVLTAATMLIYFASIFTTVGVGPALIQTPHLTAVHVSTGLVFSVLCGAVLSLFLFAAAPMAGKFFGNEQVIKIIRTLCWIYPIESAGLVAQSQLRRNLKFGTIALIESASYIGGYGIIGIGLALGGFQVWALVWAVFCQTVCRNILFVLMGPRLFVLSFNGALLKEMLMFGGGVTASQIAGYWASQADKMIVGRLLGMTALGVYGRAIAMTTTIARFFGQTLARVLFPVFSRVQKDEHLLASAFEKGIQGIALITMPLSLLGVVCGRELILILLGPAWEETIVPFQIVSAGLFFRTAVKVGDSITMARGAVYRRTWRQYMYLLTVMIFSLGGSFWGVEGVAWGTTAAWLVNFGLISDLSVRLVGMRRIDFLVLFLRPAVVTGLCGIPLAALTALLRAEGFEPMVIAAAAGLGIGVYFLLVVYSGISQFFFGRTAAWFRQQVSEGMQRLIGFRTQAKSSL